MTTQNGDINSALNSSRIRDYISTQSKSNFFSRPRSNFLDNKTCFHGVNDIYKLKRSFFKFYMCFGGLTMVEFIVQQDKQDAVRAYIWAWLYFAYDTFNMPYCS